MTIDDHTLLPVIERHYPEWRLYLTDYPAGEHHDAFTHVALHVEEGQPITVNHLRGVERGAFVALSFGQASLFITADQARSLRAQLKAIVNDADRTVDL